MGVTKGAVSAGLLRDRLRLEGALRSGDRVAAELILDGWDAPELDAQALDDLIVPVILRLDSLWVEGGASISEVYMATRLCAAIIDDRRAQGLPALRPDQPRIAICMLEDSHALGMKMVLQVMRCAGYEVADWGTRRTVNEVVDGVVREGVEVVLLSVLMLRSALRVAQVRERLLHVGWNPFIVVGGAPFRLDRGLAAEVGADFVGMSAADVLPIIGRIEALR
ncbi:MAG TPA: cobalamin-dependent protein [Motilibacterales bacterium]|nr:cobalamin-dependent protein [Motilibacterales bacterium]